jgi:hypothetical protein
MMSLLAELARYLLDHCCYCQHRSVHSGSSSSSTGIEDTVAMQPQVAATTISLVQQQYVDLELKQVSKVLI